MKLKFEDKGEQLITLITFTAMAISHFELPSDTNSKNVKERLQALNTFEATNAVIIMLCVENLPIASQHFNFNR